MNIPLFKTYFSDDCRQKIVSDLDKVLENGQLMMGPFKDKFERLFCETIGITHSISVNSGTTALTICLKYFDVTGKEVLVPSGSFVTSISSIIFARGKPVLVDMNPDTLSFDLNDLESKISPRTKGIIWVHLTGLISPEHEKIKELAKRYNLFLIEDAAHALGASVNENQAGTLADAGCFSFYPTKIITSGTGGMIVTKDKGLKDFAERMRLFGKDPQTKLIHHLGNDWFLNEINACVGYHHLLELNDSITKRIDIAEKYRNALSRLSGISMLNIPEGNQPSYYQFPVFLDAMIDRQKLIDSLKQKYQINTRGIYKPCHEERVFLQYNDETLNKTEHTLNRSLCLPMFVQVTDDEIRYVADSFIEELKRIRSQ